MYVYADEVQFDAKPAIDRAIYLYPITRSGK